MLMMSAKWKIWKETGRREDRCRDIVNQSQTRLEGFGKLADHPFHRTSGESETVCVFFGVMTDEIGLSRSVDENACLVLLYQMKNTSIINATIYRRDDRLVVCPHLPTLLTCTQGLVGPPGAAVMKNFSFPSQKPVVTRSLFF